MKLLMTTEKVDNQDHIFAFSHLWIKTIAEQVDELIVIGLSVGSYDLPKNVRVYSLGKEKEDKRQGYLKNLSYVWNFYKIIWRERKKYDYVFIHMNQIYAIMGGPFWKLSGKRIGFWYTHKAVSASLKLAVMLVDVVYTAAVESMNVKTSKKKVLGHGVLTQSFINEKRKIVFSEDKKIITSIGRITPIKDLATLISASKILIDKDFNIELRLIGPEVTELDKKYKKELESLIKKLSLENKVVFTGGKTSEETKKELWNADIHVNLCPTGGLDKAVIESACSGVHSFVANQAFKVHYGELSTDYLFDHGDEKMLAEKIKKMLELDINESNNKFLKVQNYMVKSFDVKSLIKNILEILKSDKYDRID